MLLLQLAKPFTTSLSTALRALALFDEVAGVVVQTVSGWYGYGSASNTVTAIVGYLQGAARVDGVGHLKKCLCIPLYRIRDTLPADQIFPDPGHPLFQTIQPLSLQGVWIGAVLGILFPRRRLEPQGLQSGDRGGGPTKAQGIANPGAVLGAPLVPVAARFCPTVNQGLIEAGGLETSVLSLAARARAE